MMDFMIVREDENFFPRPLEVGMRMVVFDSQFVVGQRVVRGLRFLREPAHDSVQLRCRFARFDIRHADFALTRFGDDDEHVCRFDDVLREFSERHGAGPRFVAEMFVLNALQQFFQREPMGQPLVHQLLCPSHFGTSEIFPLKKTGEERT